MTQASIEYHKQVRRWASGEATISQETLDQVKKGLESGEPQIVNFETQIMNEKNEVAAVCKTSWQIKRWDQVRTSSNGSKT